MKVRPREKFARASLISLGYFGQGGGMADRREWEEKEERTKDGKEETEEGKENNWEREG